MKKLPRLILMVGLIVFAAAGCSNREVDTVKLQTAFASADPDIRSEVDKGVTAITASNYSQALGSLKHVAYAAKLTKEQRLIVEDSIKKLKAKTE